MSVEVASLDVRVLRFLEERGRNLRDLDPLIGISDVAALAGVDRHTVYVWRVRSQAPWPKRGGGYQPGFPEPADHYGQAPVWRASQIIDWLTETHRPIAPLAP